MRTNLLLLGASLLFVALLVVLIESALRITGVDGAKPQGIETGMDVVLDLEDLDPEHPSLAFKPA